MAEAEGFGDECAAMSSLLPRPLWISLYAACLGISLLLAAPAARALEPSISPEEDFASNIRRVFAVDHQADFRVTFGYDNWTDYKDPNDPGRARNLMVYLAAHSFVQVICTEEISRQLGVPLDAKNLRVFQGPGQPGETIRVSLIWSSMTSSTAKNIGSGYAKQLVCSDQALKFMQKSASDADVMAYVGHSRGGGGPDTFPPQTVASKDDRQKVDFAYYRREHPGLNALGSSLSKFSDGPHFIVWTGCLSENFSGWLGDHLSRRTYPATAILSTRLTRQKPWEDGIQGNDESLMLITTLIEALQQHQCLAQFKERILTCEMPEMRVPDHPEWKVVSLPRPRTARQIVQNEK